MVCITIIGYYVKITTTWKYENDKFKYVSDVLGLRSYVFQKIRFKIWNTHSTPPINISKISLFK